MKVEELTIEWVDDGSGESEEESSGYYDEHWATNKPTTRYFYDGQMSFEDDYTVVSGGFGTPDVTVTRYALGARGIDAIETTTSSGASAVYPVYDGHGNMIATLARNGSSFARANNRAFDAWGSITSGSGGDQGYVANLGHRKDTESGLTYMRARYYEPETGRFISEDSAMEGPNWYVHCQNDPIQGMDPQGKSTVLTMVNTALFLLALRQLIVNSRISHCAGTVAFFGLAMLAMWFTDKKIGLSENPSLSFGMGIWATTHQLMMEMMVIASQSQGADEVKSSIAAKTIATVSNYFIIMSLFIYLEFMAERADIGSEFKVALV